MMMLTPMPASSAPNKARAYSDGDYAAREPLCLHASSDSEYFSPLQRASSSEAQLPSYHDNNGNGCKDDNIHFHDHGSLGIRGSGSGDDSYNNNCGGGATRASRLQTIESGIALADAPGASSSPNVVGVADEEIAQLRSSPRHQSHHDANSGCGFSPSLPPRHPLPPTMPPLDSADDEPESIIDRPYPIRTRVQSDQSYYSVDAGKHGFLNPNHNRGGGSHHDADHDHDSDTGSMGANSASDNSLVLKYRSGQETPPAEYALPASILKVYGVDCCDATASPGVAPVRVPVENGKRIRWHHGSYSNFQNSGSQSTILFDVERGLGDSDDGDGQDDEGRNDEDTKKQPSPPRNPSSTRVPHLPSAAASAQPSASSEEEKVPPSGRILPYHERKRLMELEEEQRMRREKRDRRSARKSTGRGARDNVKEDEATPLTSRRRGYGTDNSASSSDGDARASASAGWFGRLLSIVSCRSEVDPPARPHHEKQVSQDKNAQSYRDRGRAFLRKTERQRRMLKERIRTEELNNVTVPVSRQSFGRGQRRMSSMSNALDSIVSCSDDDEEEDESSSDEESGSSYYFDDSTDAAPAVARVWKYGEPPTANNPHSPLKKTGLPTVSSARRKGGKSSSRGSYSASKRDRAMRRERLAQEEYEYRLHSLRKENEALSRRFRVFVLVTVACVVVGALGAALVICIRVLMSL